MAGDVQKNNWPLPKFCFSAQVGDDNAAGFEEVTGLGSETGAVAYRHSNSPSFSPVKMRRSAAPGT